MGSEMGNNNNTSGLKDEENTTVETCKTSLVDTTHENDTIEEHQLVPEVEGKNFHEKVSNLTSDDPERITDPCVENQTSITEGYQNAEVHHLGETPKVTMEPTEAKERDSRLQPDVSLNDPVHEKPIEKNMEVTNLQGTMQYQIERQNSFKKEDEEDETLATSDELKLRENITSEACQTSFLTRTRESDTNEENEIVTEVEGSDFHEKVTCSATDDREMIEDPCIENQTSRTKEQEDSEVPDPLGEFPQDTMESTEKREEHGKVQRVMLSSDSGHEEPTEQNNKETVIQAETMQYQLDKQDCLKKEDEEDGTTSTPHDLEAKESRSFELNQQELVTTPADQSVEVGSGQLLGSKDCLGTNTTSDFEARGYVLDSETMKSMELSADSSSDPALEAKGDALSLKQKTCDEQLKSSEVQSETKDGEAEIGSSNKTLTSSYGHVGLENKCNVELPTEENIIDIPKSEPEEALLLSSYHLANPEPKDNCIVLEEQTRVPGNELENGDEKHCTNQIQPCLESRIESEPECDKSSEATIVESTHEKSETISVISPSASSHKVSEAEDPMVAEDDDLVLMRLNHQPEASEDQHYQESERKLEVVQVLGIISPELRIRLFNHKEEELVGKTNDQDKADNAEPSLAIEKEEAGRTGQDCLPPEENSVYENETVQIINDLIPELKKENCSDFFATENPTIDFTSWIAEALVSMNNLEAEMLGQQVTQHNETHQAKVAAAAESKTFAEEETSSVSLSSGSETQETVGRSSTTESDPDNMNIVHHAQIQKSPSFSLDLPNEARTEESDITPLLFQDKAEVEISSSQGEKVITLERSESEESKTPFLGFVKEEEENKNIHENHSPAESSRKNLGVSLTKKTTTTSVKGKEKRRHFPSLFSNCLCCTTVIN